MDRSTMGRLSGLMAAIGLAAGLAPVVGPAQAEENYIVQLASVNSEERARQAWLELQAKHAELLGDMSLTVQSAEVAGRGTFYRMQTGPFPNRATAEDMCGLLRAAKLECLVRQR